MFPVNPVAALPHEAHDARSRPPERRTPVPEPGARVWYRHDKNGPLTPARVDRIDVSNQEDWNVWRFVLDDDRRPVEVAGKRLMEMTEDPWPDVYLRTEYGLMVTREARIEGSPGWLPMKEQS